MHPIENIIDSSIDQIKKMVDVLIPLEMQLLI